MTKRTLISMLLFSVGCIEQGFHTKGTDVDAPNTPSETTEDTGTASAEEEDEICNGVDDDGDGLVDEGFQDLDADGIADCVDSECEVDAPAGGTLAVDESCGSDETEVSDPWSIDTEWTWTASGLSQREVYTTPLVAHLTDTDGDGKINLADTPNVILAASDSMLKTSTVYVLDGQTGAVIWQVSGLGFGGQPSVGDVDSDGEPEVIVFDTLGCPIALSADGLEEWAATDCPLFSSWPQASLADLDGDGVVEVVTRGRVYDGGNGDSLASFPFFTGTDTVVITAPAVADLDLDGHQEILIGNRIYQGDGTQSWKSDQVGAAHWSIPINADSDPEAEVAMVANGQLGLYDHDGTEKSLVNVHAVPSWAPSAPCAADFDGDAMPEIAWTANSVLYVMEFDGTELWQTAVTDYSSASGCSGYDFDGDGRSELVYADEEDFYIFDGLDGTVRFQETDHQSGTALEYPTIADIDNDGSAEVLFISNFGAANRLTVLGHKDDSWGPAGYSWPIHDFAETNIDPDGHIPTTPPHYWLEHNLYRARPHGERPGVDLVLSIVDVCYAGCLSDSMVRVAVQIGNQGPENATREIPMSLYAVEDENLTLLESRLLSPIASGSTTDAQVFELTSSQAGADGFLVRVNDDGTGRGFFRECLDDNNEEFWLDSPC